MNSLAIGIAFVMSQLALAGWLTWWSERRFRQRVEASHTRERGVWIAQLDALTKAMHYGAPVQPEAVITSPEPSAEEKAARAFGQESIENGIKRLREEYAALGVPNLSDDDLRKEAVSILWGASPVPSIPLLMVRD